MSDLSIKSEYFVKFRKTYPPEIYQAMVETLLEMCPRDDWYSLKEIANAFAARIGWERCTSKKAGAILDRMGYVNKRRKRHNGYYHVFINIRTLRAQKTKSSFK